MKGTPCSRGNYASLKTSSKPRTSIEVQGLGPWRGLGQRPNLALLRWSVVWGAGYNSSRSTDPAKRVRARPHLGHLLRSWYLQVQSRSPLAAAFPCKYSFREIAYD